MTIIEISKVFSFLTDHYGFSYQHQVFENCFGGNWIVETHSFYNEHGCFTIQLLPQRGEMDFYCSDSFSVSREELTRNTVDICSIGYEIWKKNASIGIFKNPFFWWNNDRVLRVLADVMVQQIENHGEVFGIETTTNNK